jgi:hypothetical protein
MPVLFISAAPNPLRTQVPAVSSTQNPALPDWALPASATHTQLSPPSDFHRPSRNFNTSIGIFDGQSDIGSAIISGSASYDTGAGQCTFTSAGYNIWYVRDEFRYLWKKMSGDVSRAAGMHIPTPKALVIARRSPCQTGPPVGCRQAGRLVAFRLVTDSQRPLHSGSRGCSD